MPKSQIEARLEEMRRRIRRLLGMHGVSWVLVVGVGVATVSGLADWLLDLSTGVRVVLLAVLVSGTLWTAYRFLLRPLLVRMRDLELALRVESRFPRLGEQLASAVEFLKEPIDSDRSGSPVLKRAVVEQATRTAELLDFSEALDRSAPRRALSCAAAVLVVASGLVLAVPGSARIALARLVNPF